MAPAATALLCCILLLSSLSLSVASSSTEVGKKWKEFDYFLLSLQWPGTYCQKTSHCCPSNGCCRKSGPLTEFTIHGLWTNYDDGTWPSCCNTNYFDLKKISSLIGTLTKYWPTLSCSSSSVCHGGKGLFWAHEWEKHGTCADPVIKDEYTYFTATLDLYFKYNITKILSDAGVLASNAEKYQSSDIVKAIKNAVGASPLLVCSHGNVEEIRLCFYKDFTPRDCVLSTGTQDNALHSSSSCPASISLPTYNPPVLAGENPMITLLPTYENIEALTVLMV